MRKKSVGAVRKVLGLGVFAATLVFVLWASETAVYPIEVLASVAVITDSSF